MSTAPVVPAVPRLRRVAEVLAFSAAGGVILAVSLRFAALGPLLALGWVVLLVPAHFDRWRAPFLGFWPGQHAALIWALWPLKKFGWFVPWLLMPILTVHYVIAALLVALVRRTVRWPAVVALPLAVGAGEWMRAIAGVGNFNMFQTGTFLFEYPVLIQAADVVGSLGLSVLWTVPYAALVDLVAWRVRGGDRARLRPVVRGLAAGAAVIVVLLAYGAFRLATSNFEEGPRIAVIQPSLDHGAELTPQVVRHQVQMTVELVPPGSADLIVWPENAVLAPYDQIKEYQDSARFVAASRRAPLLLGAQGVAQDGRRPTNTAFLVGEDGAVQGRYDKVVLFPFTERRALPWVAKISPWLDDRIGALVRAAWKDAADGWAPDAPALLTLDTAAGGLPFWTPICYESCYPELGRQTTRGGARFVVNLTSEGWLGWGASNNQMGANVLRAVENRVGLVRAGNTGPSAFIFPDGRIDRYLRGLRTGRLRLEPGVLIHRVMLDPRGMTFYSRFGGLVDVLPAAALAVALLLHAARRRRARRSAAPGGAA